MRTTPRPHPPPVAALEFTSACERALDAAVAAWPTRIGRHEQPVKVAAAVALVECDFPLQRVRAHFAPWLPGEVDAWPLPNILALKFVLKGALQGGGARNLRLDNLGKAMAGALLRMEIEVSAEELDEATKRPRVGWWGEQ